MFQRDSSSSDFADFMTRDGPQQICSNMHMDVDHQYYIHQPYSPAHFDHEVDSHLFGTNATIIFPLESPDVATIDPWLVVDAGSSPASSVWSHSDVTTPPASPDSCPPDVSEYSSSGEDLLADILRLSEEELLTLAASLSSAPKVEPPIANAVDPGTRFLSPQFHPATTAPGYWIPPVVGYEQPRTQHSDAALADAHGQEAGMQVNHEARDPYPALGRDASPPPDVSPQKVVKTAPYKPKKGMATAKKTCVKPAQGAKPERKYPCTVPGCAQGALLRHVRVRWHSFRAIAFARTFNMHEHVDKKHKHHRPWKCPAPGCIKAAEGYSRKADCKVHLMKKHPELSGLCPLLEGSKMSMPSRVRALLRSESHYVARG
ncbi:hypothetical protein C8Q77DRAFT_189799 [Trametes polyzona]|nr:hypothetical protein C8Q77DRAFT_189799 [Trametes polyzona]